ncbi:hypothetical protein HMPREF0043_01317 [Actinobaculum sp. oral taxon 183 str. F0552]|nr:hypothetical protein HMPREF0043_01317 [Actinobaculum sp. oral taxon 183 str. F0552]
MNPPEIPEGSSDLRPRGAAPHGRSERDRPGIADVRVEFDFSDPREVGRRRGIARSSPRRRLRHGEGPLVVPIPFPCLGS